MRMFSPRLLSAIALLYLCKPVWTRLERRDTAIAVRRLAAPGTPSWPGALPAGIDRRSPERSGPARQPNCWCASGFRQAAERLLETAGLKWGRCRADASFRRDASLGVFALVTLFMRNSYPTAGARLPARAAPPAAPRLCRGARPRQRQQIRRTVPRLSGVHLPLHARRPCLLGRARNGATANSAIRWQASFAAPSRNRTWASRSISCCRKLGQRMPSMDVQFFVSAVLLQKRTGGNLAELLDKLAHIIRERFKLRGRIRAVSAQGLMSGPYSGVHPGRPSALDVHGESAIRAFLRGRSDGPRMLAGRSRLATASAI